MVTSDELAKAPMEILGQLRGASNGTFLVALGGDEHALAVYKPVTGERPLWDFREASLSGREVAVAALDRLMGLDLVPETVWRDSGQLGPGMCQAWVSESGSDALVDIVPDGMTPEGWIGILRARDDEGSLVELVHADHPRLRDMVLLDAVVNNADRKAGHVLVSESGAVFGIDHGICLNAENKLRTVLWGWSGDDLTGEHVRALNELHTRLEHELAEVDRWLDLRERSALRRRVAHLVSTGVYPVPSTEWPAIPWPVF